MAWQSPGAGIGIPGLTSDGQVPPGIVVQGAVQGSLLGITGADVADPLAYVASDGSATLPGDINVKGASIRASNPPAFSGVVMSPDGTLTGSNADATAGYVLSPTGEAQITALGWTGSLSLPNGAIAAAPVSLTASLANQQAQINELVALLVAWGVVTDDRVP